MYRYRNVKCSLRGISGETSRFGGWTRFASSPNLFLVSLAMDLMPDSLMKFMALADGYGMKGYFPGGYDWSGIRDSSQEARVEMGDYARVLLRKYPDSRFLDVGLPQEVIDLHIRKPTAEMQKQAVAIMASTDKKKGKDYGS